MNLPGGVKRGEVCGGSINGFEGGGGARGWPMVPTKLALAWNMAT